MAKLSSWEEELIEERLKMVVVDKRKVTEARSAQSITIGGD